MKSTEGTVAPPEGQTMEQKQFQPEWNEQRKKSGDSLLNWLVVPNLVCCSRVLPACTLLCGSTQEGFQTGKMMNEVASFHIPMEELASACRQYQVRELALFGSMLRSDSDSESDVDMLVSFQPEARVTFVTLARMQCELEALLGRKADLVPKDGLKPVIRDHDLATARVRYAACIPLVE